MSNGELNLMDDSFITSDLQEHVIMEQEEEEEEVIGRRTRRRRDIDDEDSDYKVDDDDNDSDYGSKKNDSRRSVRSSGRVRTGSFANNGSETKTTSSGRIIRPPIYAGEDDDSDEDYDFGPKRKRGRPRKSQPVPASKFKAVKENPRLSGSRSYQRGSPKDRCNLCNLVLRTDGLVVEHIKNDHVLPCLNPEDMYIEKTGVKSFLCSLCGSNFDARIKFKFHKRSKHGITGGGEDEDAAVECDLCETIVENKGELVIHKESKHGNLKTYHCDYCNDKYFSSDDLVDHRRVMHEDQVNKIIEPWVNIKRTEDQILKEMFPAGQGYATMKRKSAPSTAKSFPKRILDPEELPPSSPEKSPGNTSSSDYEPDNKDDDDDDFDPSMGNTSRKKKKGRPPRSSSGRPSNSGAASGSGGAKKLSLESLGIDGLSKEGLENFKSAPPDIQKKVLKLLMDKKGREAVLKKLGNNSPGTSPGVKVEHKRRRTTNVSALTVKLQATLQKLLEKKKPKMFDCPECPHRFPTKELLVRHEKSAHTYKPPPKPVFTGTCQICSEVIPTEKDYVQHLLSLHMTPDVDVLSVAAGILVKRVAKDFKPQQKKNKQKSTVKPKGKPKSSTAPNSSNIASTSNDRLGTHDADASVNSNDAGANKSKTTIEPVIDDSDDDDDEPVIDDGEPVIDDGIS